MVVSRHLTELVKKARMEGMAEFGKRGVYVKPVSAVISFSCGLNTHNNAVDRDNEHLAPPLVKRSGEIAR